MVNPGSLLDMPAYRPPLTRMMNRIEFADDGCWNWTGGTTSRGYGKVNDHDRALLTHRVMYEEMIGPHAEGLQLDHLCRNTLCCNPAHLEPVTQAENMHRTRKDFCIHGHDMSIHARPIGNTRRCWECHKRNANKSRDRKEVS